MTSKRRSLINLLSLSYLSKSKTTLTVSSNIKADRAPFVRGREGARGGARGREGARGGARGREGAHYYVCKMTSHNLHMRGRTEDEFLLVNGDPLKNHRKKPREKRHHMFDTIEGLMLLYYDWLFDLTSVCIKSTSV